MLGEVLICIVERDHHAALRYLARAMDIRDPVIRSDRSVSHRRQGAHVPRKRLRRNGKTLTPRLPLRADMMIEENCNGAGLTHVSMIPSLRPRLRRAEVNAGTLRSLRRPGTFTAANPSA